MEAGREKHETARADPSAPFAKYFVGIEDNETFIAVCFACLIGTILLAFIHQNTNFFVFLHDLLMGKDEMQFSKDWRERNLRFALESNPVFTMFVFTLVTILIYYLVFKYVIKQNLHREWFGFHERRGRVRYENFGGRTYLYKYPEEEESEGRHSARLKLKRHQLTFVEQIPLSEFERQKKEYTEEQVDELEASREFH